MDLPDPCDQPRVREVTVTRRPPLPGMKTRTRHPQHTAEQRDRMVGLLHSDEAEALHRVSLSRAKKAAAFFKISRSCSSVRTLRRSSRSSARSSLVSPSRSPASVSACFTHDRSDSIAIPRSTAISRSGLPLRRYSSTASRRNSGVYGLLKFDPLGMVAHPPRQAGRRRPSAQMSTKTGALHERESRALPPNDGARMGLRPQLPLTPTPQPGAATLAQPLQPDKTTQLTRRTATNQPRSQR